MKWFPALLLLAGSDLAISQEVPYFITYSHHMEEPGSVEVEVKTAEGRPAGGNRFFGNSVELEYGTTAWWTSELYVDFTGTNGDSTVPGGFRLENRVRPLLSDHWINPVLYFEYEDINAANKSVLEVVGHDIADDFTGPMALARQERKHEVELKLILSSDIKGWNLAENLIFEKNLDNSPWEFGYALATSRPLRLQALARPCIFCSEKFTVGAEMYGGLGTRYNPGLHDTSHYAGPIIGWQLPHDTRLSLEEGFGLSSASLDHITRFGVAYEFGQLPSLRGGR